MCLICDKLRIVWYIFIKGGIFMTINMTIQNADNVLLTAIKSVCKLHPEAKVSIKKQKL